MRLYPIEKVENMKSEDFLKNYFHPARPVVLKDFIDKESPAFEKWNYSYFKEIAGKMKVNIYGSEIESLDRVASKPIAESTFGDYLDLIEEKPTENRLFLFNLLNFKPELKRDVKYKNITKGKILEWLPFMFFGGEGSITRNHVDIDMSHVFISQFQGKKRIWLFSPEESDLLYKLPYNFHSLANVKEIDYSEYPALHYLKGYETVISPGETLYIPSGWWHYIQYETEGYSISVRALPSSISEKWKGFRNLFITRNFDQLMRKMFGEKWFDYKVILAKKRANKAIQRMNPETIIFTVLAISSL